MIIFEIILFAGVLLIAASIVLATLKTGISPMFSSAKACRAMLANADGHANGTFIDMGSGWGTLVIALARKYPQRRIIGYEVSYVPWLVSQFRKHCLRLGNLDIYRMDFLKADLKTDLNQAAVLFCYLFPKGMQHVQKKLARELSKEIFIISNTFALPAYKPEKIIRLNDTYNSPIYIYRLNPQHLHTNLSL